MITISSKGSFKNTEKFLSRMTSSDIFRALGRYGDEGVAALASATPVESGITANSWSYEVAQKSGSYSIVWKNSHAIGSTPLVILLQYGHGTGTGGYVEGQDFINPAIRPIFDRIAREVWRVVTSA